MTWMDSYYRVHTLLLSMMDRDQDVRDIVGDTAYILHAGCGMEPILWAISAWLAMVDYINHNRIHPNINRSICVGACKALGIAVQGAIDHHMATIDSKEDINGNQVNAGTD